MKFPQDVSKSVRKRNPHLYGPSADSLGAHAGAQSEPGLEPEQLAADAAQIVGEKRRLVRFTLHRTRLLDEDNPFVKPFLDGLKEAGIVVDDSPAWCKVEVVQKLVDRPEEEGTMIEIFE